MTDSDHHRRLLLRDLRSRKGLLALLALAAGNSGCEAGGDDDDTEPAGLHDPLEVLLDGFTSTDGDGNALVDHDGLAADSGALAGLDGYLADLAVTDPATLADDAERLAFWLNAYNAAVLKGVLDAYGGDHGFTVLDSGTFFDTAAYEIAGTTLSLNQLEHGAIRGKMDHPAVTGADQPTQDAITAFHEGLWHGNDIDARIHVGLNCASIGCPNLRGAAAPLAFTGVTVDAQLDTASQVYCDDAYKGAGADGISRIFQWFGGDFDAEYGGVNGFIETHRTDGLTGVDAGSWLDYDWTLNIAP